MPRNRGKTFLKLPNKYFIQTNKLHPVFRNIIKLSYSWTKTKKIPNPYLATTELIIHPT